MRGEKSLYCCTTSRHHGSPPLVRGKEADVPAVFPHLRITPACAGKSEGRRMFPPDGGDHPRLCGEKLSSSRAWKVWEGSPPLVRGKDNGIIGCLQNQGITPACAGKSGLSPVIAVFRGDHPRLCGEKLIPREMELMRSGSPPLARGKGHPESFRMKSPGITPACAGKRALAPPKAPAPWDHPRLRGEKMPRRA